MTTQTNREAVAMPAIERMSTVRLERLYVLALDHNPSLALRVLAVLHARHGCLETS